MHHDRLGLRISTASAPAAQAYRDAVDLMLAGWPGAAEKLDQAVNHDPAFALAHAARARLHAMYLERDPAQAAIAAARRASQHATARERQHVEVLALASEGQAARAMDLAPRHLDEHPRDALVLSTLLGAFGLYAFSGRADHDGARVVICERLATDYGDDWWFLTYRGWSLVENGAGAPGRAYIERALDLKLDNAHGAHALAHAMFEDGDGDAAQHFITGWLPSYPAAGVLHSHIAWHRALHAMEAGDTGVAFQTLRQTLDPAITQAPPLNALTDLASMLWRLTIYGHEVPAEAWQRAAQFSDGLTARLAAPFAAVHYAMVEAGTGNLAAIEARASALDARLADGKLMQGAVLPSLCRALGAYAGGDYRQVIASIEPHLADIVRIGGSHAQREVFEDTFIAACLKAGEAVKAARLLDERLHRRPSPRDQRWRALARGLADTKPATR